MIFKWKHYMTLQCLCIMRQDLRPLRCQDYLLWLAFEQKPTYPDNLCQLSDVTSIMGTSHIQMPGARPHIVTLFTVHTSLGITLLSLANQKHGMMSSDQSEACILSSLCTGWPQLISRPVIHHPVSCLMTTTFIVSLKI